MSCCALLHIGCQLDGVAVFLLLGQLAVYFCNHLHIGMSHPYLQRFQGDAGKVAPRAKIYTEVVAADGHFAPRRQLLPLRNYLLMLNAGKSFCLTR